MTPVGVRLAGNSPEAGASAAKIQSCTANTTGTPRRKLPAVSRRGCAEFFPRMEYMPQDAPERNISAAPEGDGAERPGMSRKNSPASARSSPAPSRSVNASPCASPQATMMPGTAAAMISVPTAAGSF